MALFARLGDWLATSIHVRNRARVLYCALASLAGLAVVWTALGHGSHPAPRADAPAPELAAAPWNVRPAHTPDSPTPAIAVKPVLDTEHVDASASPAVVARVECDSQCGAGAILMPRERHKRPDYVVDSPDILHISVNAEGGDAVALEAINGDRLVEPDGSLTLSKECGRVQVGGLTLGELPEHIADALQPHLGEVHVLVSVTAQNSKVYYIVTDSADEGDTVMRMPALGGETVRDALANLNDIDWSEKNVWIARPSMTDGEASDELLTVNAAEVVDGSDTSTNYPLLPGDRLFVTNPPAIWHTFTGILSSTWDTLIEMFW